MEVSAMAYTDLTLPQFQEQFSSEEACLQAVFDARWPRGFICPKCGHNDGYRLSRQRVIQCCSCHRQSSITAGTIFHRTHLPLRTWFLIIFLVAQDKGGISAQRVADLMGMHYTTALLVLQRIRFAMGNRDENLKLAGYIELDEAFFGGRGRKKVKDKDAQSLRAKKKQILVFVESEGKQAGNLAMVVVPNANYDTLKPILERRIESEPSVSHFRTDGWQSHEVVISLGNKLTMGHIPNHLQDAEFPCLSLAITHARRFLMGTHHQFCKRNLQRYLDEFCYRWNRRHQRCQIFSRLVSACALSTPALAA
jgi:hypothetical protein